MTEVKTLIIRETTSSDAEDIVYVNVCAWKESYSGIIDKTYLDELYLAPERVESRTKSIEHNKDSMCFVAIKDNTLVGFCDVGIIDKASGESKLFTLYLLDNYKRQSIGSKLFKQVLSWAKAHDCERLEIGVLSENTSAKLFYQSKNCTFSHELDTKIGQNTYKESVYYLSL